LVVGVQKKKKPPSQTGTCEGKMLQLISTGDGGRCSNFPGRTLFQIVMKRTINLAVIGELLGLWKKANHKAKVSTRESWGLSKDRKGDLKSAKRGYHRGMGECISVGEARVG